MARRMTIYLLLRMSREFSRQLFRGMIRWSNLYGPVSFVTTTEGHMARILSGVQDLDCVGMIARLPTPGVVRSIRNLHIPTVTVEPSIDEFVEIKDKLEVSEIVSDSPAIAQMAFEHFRARGFHHFGFCGLPQRIWSRIRGESFLRFAQESGFDCSIYPCPSTIDRAHPGKERPRLLSWLKKLPRPTAIFCCNDDRAAQLIEVCSRMGISVPEEIAVLGVDNDELLCELTNPTLSSIKLDLERVGFQAMSLLSELITGTKKGYYQIPLKPLYVATRFSSDVVSQDDELVNRAVRFIRKNYRSPIGVENIIRSLDVSRRTLERHFADVLHHSVTEQIQLFRLEHAKYFLLETKENVQRIAEISGFSHFKTMLRVFNQYEKMSPTQFRKQHRKIIESEDEGRYV